MIAKLLLLVSVGIAVMVSGFAARGSTAPPRPSAVAPSPSSSPARDADATSLRLTGVVEAVHFAAIRAPQLSGANPAPLVITRLIPKGASVRAGDLVVEFDRQQQQRAAEDKRAEWLDFEEQIRKKRAEQLAQQAKDETEVKTAENALALARLDVLKNELLPRIEAEKNDLTLEAAQARLAQLRETFTLKRTAEAAEVRILEVQRDRAGLVMRQAEQNAERMAVRAPIDGLIVYRSVWRGGQMADPQEGLELWSGAAVLDIVGADAMRVRVKVNQADVDRLRAGLSARVRLDAYPDRAYAAVLEQLAPIGVAGGFSPKVRTFAATFRLARGDAMLMPDLSAAVDVDLDQRGTR